MRSCGVRFGWVFLIVLTDFREVVLDIDAAVELIFEVGFKVLLLTASFTQVEGGKVRRRLGRIVGELLQRQWGNSLRSWLAAFGDISWEWLGNRRLG
jgi:hypothetical protein